MRKQKIGICLLVLFGMAAIAPLFAAFALNLGKTMEKTAISSQSAKSYRIIPAVADQPVQDDLIDSKEELCPTEQKGTSDWEWSAADNELLMKIAMAEAEGEGVKGKALVMLVVLNRVWSDAFPDTVEEVIFQSRQFTPTAPGGRYYTTEPDEGCQEALVLVMGGWDESGGALYFESGSRDGWHSRNLEFLFQHGNHKFYR